MADELKGTTSPGQLGDALPTEPSAGAAEKEEEAGSSQESVSADQGRQKFLERTSAIAGLIQSAATVLALAIGGLVTYYLFDPLAEWNPNLSLAQTVESRGMAVDSAYLFVNVVLKNTSKRVLHISCAEIRVSRVLPLTIDQYPAMAKQASSLMGEGADFPTVQYEKVSFPKGTFVEPQGEMRVPWNLIITRRVSKDDAHLLLSTISVESAFQIGQPPTYDCRTGSHGGMDGPYWAVTTIADLSGGDAK
jgi:hypothetical protein